MTSQPRTLFDKIWQSHLIDSSNGADTIYIDHHLVHEVTSPQAFEGLKLANRKPWRIAAGLAVPDHNVPTTERENITDPVSKLQLETLDKNCKETGIVKRQRCAW